MELSFALATVLIQAITTAAAATTVGAVVMITDGVVMITDGVAMITDVAAMITDGVGTICLRVVTCEVAPLAKLMVRFCNAFAPALIVAPSEPQFTIVSAVEIFPTLRVN
jgi:hypothetical protein